MHIKYRLPKEFFQLDKHKPIEISMAAKGRQQILRAWGSPPSPCWSIFCS